MQSLKTDAIRPLTKQEIDRRIDDVAAQLSGIEPLRRERASAEDALRPQWIAPAELVRRLKPFIVLN